jgi:hypothetical protein
MEGCFTTDLCPVIYQAVTVCVECTCCCSLSVATRTDTKIELHCAIRTKNDKNALVIKAVMILP